MCCCHGYWPPLFPLATCKAVPGVHWCCKLSRLRIWLKEKLFRLGYLETRKHKASVDVAFLIQESRCSRMESTCKRFRESKLSIINYTNTIIQYYPQDLFLETSFSRQFQYNTLSSATSNDAALAHRCMKQCIGFIWSLICQGS